MNEEKKNDILHALSAIPASSCTYTEWTQVGMALKEEGFDVSAWDEWSRNDSRYHEGECEKKWGSFKGAESPIKAGTIFDMAKQYGYVPASNKAEYRPPIEFRVDSQNYYNFELIYPGNDQKGYDAGFSEGILKTGDSGWNGANDLLNYLNALFPPYTRDEKYCLGYVASDAYNNGDKWLPGKGVYFRTIKEVRTSLQSNMQKFPDNPDEALRRTLGDYKAEAGAWIRFNPLDGQGVKNENVTQFKYGLVESDTLPIDEQYDKFIKLKLPIAALVYSGGKSIHAIVHIDAPDYKEYRSRISFLYDHLAKDGIEIDKQNKNPSRLSRLPGVTRKGVPQKLLGVNLGYKSWDAWIDFVNEDIEDDLPDIKSEGEIERNPLPLAPELIEGVLRIGHKMLISGAAKAGKSFLLMELAIAIAHGREWLGLKCREGVVLYINFEIDAASAQNRISAIKEAWEIPPLKEGEEGNLFTWDLRGYAQGLDVLANKIVRASRTAEKKSKKKPICIIIDPIYKIITGDENNASDMGKFCNGFDRICSKTGASVVYAHHHSKGAQGGKKAQDRASGSGVFARDPDAQLDMIELEVPGDMVTNGEIPFRIESSLREFPNLRPLNIWFKWPVHEVDDTGALAGLSPSCGGSEPARHSGGGREERSAKEDGRGRPSMSDRIDEAFEFCAENGECTVSAIAGYLGVSERTVRNYVSQNENYVNRNGYIRRRE